MTDDLLPRIAAAEGLQRHEDRAVALDELHADAAYLAHRVHQRSLSPDEVASVIRAKIDAFLTPRRMSEAPRDGTRVLAWWPLEPHGGNWATTVWAENTAIPYSTVEPFKGWYAFGSMARHNSPYAPTHWLPHLDKPEGEE